MRKISSALTIILMLCLLCACVEKQPAVLYETDEPNANDGITKIYRVEKQSPPNEQPYVFDTTQKTKDTVQSEVRAVVTAKIVNSDELGIDFTMNEENQTRYISYVQVEITDVFFDKGNELSKGSKIWIYYVNNTHTYVNALPLMEEDEEYFLFLNTMISPFHDFGKYNVYMPQTLLFKKSENGFYDFAKMLDVFTVEDFGLVEGAVPTLEIMHEFFDGTANEEETEE